MLDYAQNVFTTVVVLKQLIYLGTVSGWKALWREIQNVKFKMQNLKVGNFVDGVLSFSKLVSSFQISKGKLKNVSLFL